MVASNEVLLVRHGETDDNVADRFQGRIDSPLNDRGREQSRVLAAQLRGSGLRALYASPLTRARETAAIIGEHRLRVAEAIAAVRGGPLPALVVCHGGTIRAVGGLAGPRGEVLNCELHRLPVPAASIT